MLFWRSSKRFARLCVERESWSDLPFSIWHVGSSGGRKRGLMGDSGAVRRYLRKERGEIRFAEEQHEENLEWGSPRMLD